MLFRAALAVVLALALSGPARAAIQNNQLNPTGSALACSGVPYIDVRCYGAQGNDTADDTAAIASAVADAIAGNVPVHFSAGTYKVTAKLTWDYQGIAASGLQVQSDGATIDGRTIASGNVLQIKCSGGTPSNPANCSHLRISGSLTVTGNTPAYVIDLGNTDLSDQHFAARIDHLVAVNNNTLAGAGGIRVNWFSNGADLWLSGATSGGGAGVAVEQLQNSRLAGYGKAAGATAPALLIENGMTAGVLVSGFAFDASSPICLSITAASATKNSFLSPYFQCAVPVNATQSAGGNVLVSPTYAVSNSPIAIGIATVGRGGLNRNSAPAAAAYTAGGVDEGLILSSANATGAAAGWAAASLPVTLPTPAQVGAGWTMGFVTDGGKAVVLNPPGGVSLLAGGVALSTLTLGPGNYQVAVLESDGSNFRVVYASPQTLAINGALNLSPSRWVYPGGPGYQATLGDSGNVLSSSLTASGLAVTLPAPAGLPVGWMLGLDRSGQPLTVTPNGVGGAQILLTNGNAVTGTYTLPTAAGYRLTLQFDGANFRVVDEPAATAARNLLDVFLVAGQSNAQGAATDTTGGPSVPPGLALQYYQGVISPANDPVGNALTGSAWPAFTAHYAFLSGRKVMVVPAAVGGTDQCAATGLSQAGNWDTTGTLRATSVATLNLALTAAAAAGYTPVFRGVIWSQGENDAVGIQVGNITQAQYQTCLINMIAAYRAATIGGQTYPQMPFYISETGGTRLGDSIYYQQVRAAQETVGEGDPWTQIVFANAIDFIARGMMCNGCGGSQLHYEQTGYNEMGRQIAANILAGGSRAAAWQRGGATGFGYGTNDLYWSRGRVTIGAAVPGEDEFDAYGTTANPIAGGFWSSAPAGQPNYTLRIANTFANTTLDQRVTVLLQPAWGGLGDSYGAALVAQQDQATGRGNIILGGYAAGVFQETARFGYDHGVTIGGYTAGANGGSNGAGTLTLYNTVAAGSDDNMLILLNRNATALDERVGILMNPSNAGDLTYGRGLITSWDQFTGRGNLRLGGYSAGTWATQATLFYDGCFVLGSSNADCGAGNAHFQAGVTIDGAASFGGAVNLGGAISVSGLPTSSGNHPLCVNTSTGAISYSNGSGC